MSLISIKNKWDIAIDGQGYMLRGTPESPRYRVNQGSLFNQRYAQGDRSYNDLSQFWFTVQTDWFTGIKSEQTWEDDGKYYVSTNMDPLTEPGILQTALSHDSNAGYTFTESIACGSDGLVSADSGKFIGTAEDTGTSEPKIYKEGSPTWSDITPTHINSSNLDCCTLYQRSGVLWAGFSVEQGYAGVPVVSYNTTGVVSAWYNCSTNIINAIDTIDTGYPDYEGIQSCLAMVAYDDDHYVFVNTHNINTGANIKWHLMTTDETEPTTSGAWTRLATGYGAKAISCAEYGGNIYFLTYAESTTIAELWKYDLANTNLISIQRFHDTNFKTDYNCKYLFTLNGKLIITVPDREIWEYDGSTVSRIYTKNETKNNLGQHIYSTDLYYGGQVVADKAYWHNLIYDGTNFHNWIKDPIDSDSDAFVPLFVTTDNKWYGTSTYDDTKLYGMATGSYKGTTGKNFLIINNINTISGVDKISYFVDLIFDPLQENDVINIYYTTDELTTSTSWTLLGTASYSVDGDSVIKKRLLFDDNVTFRKIWFKIDMENDSTSTPRLKDFIFAYLPKPHQDAVWTMTINCSDYADDWQGAKDTRRGREIKEKLWLLLRNQETVDYQDINYATTTLDGNYTAGSTTINVDDTSEFPESGRLMIGDTIYYYTGKTQTSFTGVTDGEKETQSTNQTDGTQVHNGFKVKIQSIDTIMPTGHKTDTREGEFDIQVSLREVR